VAAAITVDKLSKRYEIGMRERRHDSLRDQVPATLRRLTTGRFRRQRDYAWALQDVSLEVAEGEVLGVIGRNGAGKSTLLKILSRITLPTSGAADVYGRLGSLLEVGTGFHPDLTGRENVYLNGAILGMRRAEIQRKFNDIVEFSGVEKYLETPVKRYSSGMYVRLAFAVAAYLETDILVVDEVLAVGDHAFQQKCLGAMRNAAGSGRTVLFVSHSMPAVATLCDRAVLLDGGRVSAEGSVEDVVRRYLSVGEIVDGVIPDGERVVGTRELLFRRIALLDDDGNRIGETMFGRPLRLRLTFEVLEGVRDAALEVGISDSTGTRIVTVTTLDNGGAPMSLDPGMWEMEVEIDAALLPHEYQVDIAAHHWLESKVTIDWVQAALTFRALDVGPDPADHYIRFSPRYSLSGVRGFVRSGSAWSEPHEAAM
jgi:lipopolysaccharide transport system ATP-binding protein